MNDSFDTFLVGVESSSREAELARLLASKAAAQEETLGTRADLSVADEEMAALDSPRDEMLDRSITEALVKKASDISKLATECEKAYAHSKTQLSKFTSQLQSNKESVKELLEKGDKIGAQAKEVDPTFDVFQDVFPKAEELLSEAKKRNQLAAASFSMTDFVMEVNLVTEQRKIKADLLTEKDALLAVVDELDRDIEHREAEARKDEEEMAKLAEELEKIKASLADVDSRSESLAHLLSETSEKLVQHEKVFSEAQEKESARLEREKVAKANLEAALAKKADVEAKTQEEMARHEKATERTTLEMGDLERAMEETKIIHSKKMSEILKEKEEQLAEAGKYQVKIDSATIIWTQCLDEDSTEMLFSMDMEEARKKIERTKEAMERTKKRKETDEKMKEEELHKKEKEVEALEAELAANEALLNDDAAVLKKEVESLQKKRLDLRKEVGSLSNESDVVKDRFHRSQLAAARTTISQESLRQNALNQSVLSRSSMGSNDGRKSLDGRVKRANREDQKSGTQVRRVDRQDESPLRNTVRHTKMTPPPKKYARMNDSLFNSSVSSRGNNSSLNMTFGSTAWTNNDQPPPPPRKAVGRNESIRGDDSFNLTFGTVGSTKNRVQALTQLKNSTPPPVSRDSTLIIDPSQFVTSTPKSHKGTACALPPQPKPQPVAPRALRGRRGGKK